MSAMNPARTYAAAMRTGVALEVKVFPVARTRLRRARSLFQRPGAENYASASFTQQQADGSW